MGRWDEKEKEKEGGRWASGTLPSAELLSASLGASSVKDTLRRVNWKYHTRELVSVVCPRLYACHTKMGAALCPRVTQIHTHTHTYSRHRVQIVRTKLTPSNRRTELLVHSTAKNIWTAAQMLFLKIIHDMKHWSARRADRGREPPPYLFSELWDENCTALPECTSKHTWGCKRTDIEHNTFIISVKVKDLWLFPVLTKGWFLFSSERESVKMTSLLSR